MLENNTVRYLLMIVVGITLFILSLGLGYKYALQTTEISENAGDNTDSNLDIGVNISMRESIIDAVVVFYENRWEIAEGESIRSFEIHNLTISEIDSRGSEVDLVLAGMDGQVLRATAREYLSAIGENDPNVDVVDFEEYYSVGDLVDIKLSYVPVDSGLTNSSYENYYQDKYQDENGQKLERLLRYMGDFGDVKQTEREVRSMLMQDEIVFDEQAFSFTGVGAAQ